jgi:hypothetical protein
MSKQSSRQSVRLRSWSKHHGNLEKGVNGITTLPSTSEATHQTNAGTKVEKKSETSAVAYHRPVSGASARYNDCGILPSE